MSDDKRPVLGISIGDPGGIGGLVDRVSTPDYAAAVGLLLYGFNEWKEKGFSRDKKKGFLFKLKDWLKET